MLGDIRDIIETVPLRRTAHAVSRRKPDPLRLLQMQRQEYDDGPFDHDFYEGYATNDFGQLSDLASRCHMMLGVSELGEATYRSGLGSYVIREAISQHLPIRDAQSG